MDRRKQKGITLVALVITIIILLILAGVAINLVLGEHGIFKTAQNAKAVTTNAINEENVKLAYNSAIAEHYANKTDMTIVLKNELEKIYGENKVTIEENETQYVLTIDGIGEYRIEKLPTSNNVGVSASSNTTHVGKKLNYSWSELLNIANLIANNNTINSDTAEIMVNGKTIGVGDYTTLKYPDSNGNLLDKKVRIIGFNHDDLTDNEEETITGKAGITFEFVTALTQEKMNTSNELANWENSLMDDYMVTYLEILENANTEVAGKIKEVTKLCGGTYPGYKKEIETSSSKLWLLACSEIWNNGVDSNDYGTAVGNEGDRYKYFDIVVGNTLCSESVLELKKYSDYDASTNTDSNPGTWWLRSGYYNDNISFCHVTDEGKCSEERKGPTGHSAGFLIAPIFCI